jgi:prophage maintenance system killer protein
MTENVGKQKGEIVIYRTEDGQAAIDVRLQEETVWLSQAQMVKLFQRDQSVISRHIGNVFRERELDEKSNMHFLHIPHSDKPVAFFSLNVIISVGYRVKSKRGTQFRIWATNVLREHLVRGYTLNEKRLHESKKRLKELEAAVELVEKAKSAKALSESETAGLLTVITEYTRSWLLLHQYDSGTLATRELHGEVQFRITEDEAKKAIHHLRKDLMQRKEASDLFGCERERGILKGILGSIEQTFGGKELYPSVEDKAANLLYFLVKDHPFVDGNKRIASLVFIWFLEKNSFLSTPEGSRKINDNALVALTLLVAESNPKQKDMMIKLIINLISGR